MFFVTARPRGWKWRVRSGSLQTLNFRFTCPITPRLRRGLVPSITVIVSWPLFATYTRRPLGETTTFQGSEPVTICPFLPARLSALALSFAPLAFVMRITVTDPDAAFATYA